ncbi:MAG: Ldh family oxidoreductase [Spirochaetales bacterium]|nr:Ldh family oxidoreductase [Spirochaetales bacterium]
MIRKLETVIDYYTKELALCGVEEVRARTMATAQIEVHAFGTDTHGIPPLENMISILKKHPDRIEPPRLVRSFGAIAVADCSRTPAVEPIIWGAERAAALARKMGIGYVSLIDGGWVGTMGYHLARYAREGFLMMSWNQTSSLPMTPPHGGKEARFNTSPLAFSFPLGEEEYRDRPVVSDFSTSAISMGKTRRMRDRGELAPEKLYIDRDGRYTDDPAVTGEGGSILPFGGERFGFRGTAMALLAEAMTAAAGTVPVNPHKKGGQNVHVLALNIEALGGGEEYGPRMEELMDWVLACEPVPGGPGVRYPGQRGWEALERARNEGVSLEGDYPF